MENLGENGKALVEALNRIDGITEVGLHLYEVSVEIGHAFEWDDIVPQVIDALQNVYSNGEPIGVVGYPTATKT